MCGWLGKLKKDRIWRTCHLVSPKVLSLSTWSADVNIYILWTSQLCCYYQNTFIFLMLYLLICYSVIQSCPALCNSMDWACQASLSFAISQTSHKLMSIESVIPSNHLTFCHPLLLLPSIFPIIRVFSRELALHIMWPKYWGFSCSISPSSEYSGLISFAIDWFDLLQSRELSRVFSSTTVQKNQFLGWNSGS